MAIPTLKLTISGNQSQSDSQNPPIPVAEVLKVSVISLPISHSLLYALSCYVAVAMAFLPLLGNHHYLNHLLLMVEKQKERLKKAMHRKLLAQQLQVRK